MRRAMVWGFVLVAVAVIFTGAQALVPIQQPPTKTAQEVEVTNFPAVQTVAGSVEVANLPLDQDGNVKVANAASTPAQIHAVGITAALVGPGASAPLGLLTMNRACAAEFPATRACGLEEAFRSIPAPPTWDGLVWIVQAFETGNAQCYSSDGVGAPCKPEVSDTGLHPILCCGF